MLAFALVGGGGVVDGRSPSTPPSLSQQVRSTELSWTEFPRLCRGRQIRSYGRFGSLLSGVCRRCALHIRPLQFRRKATNIPITREHLSEHQNATRPQSFITAQACSLPPKCYCQCVVMNSLIFPFFIKTVISEINVLHLQLLNLPRLGQLLQ